MQENYITASETIYLVAYLVGPWLIICTALQVFLFKYMKVFKKENRLVIYSSLLASILLIVVFSIALWVLFPMLAPNVMTDHGINSMPFIPAVISSLVVFIIGSFLTVLLCKKS